MSESTIRAAIVTIVDGASGTNNVYAYRRWKSQWKDLLALFKDSTDTFNGWMVSRVQTAEAFDGFGKVERTHQFKIYGVLALKDDDATEVTFQALVEGVCTALRTNGTLNSTAEESGPPQVPVLEPRLFGGVLVHYCEIVLEATEREDA